MEVSSVQSGSSLHDIFSTQERKKQTTSIFENHNTGSDTASISDEARAKYQAAKNGDTDPENNAAPARSSSLSGMGRNLFSMILESLFLAELDQAQNDSASSSHDSTNGEATEGMPQSSSERVGERNPFNDSGKVAEINLIKSMQQNETAQTEDINATEEFSTYMKAKRSKAQGGSAENRVKQLQDRLKNLQNRMYQLTSGGESTVVGNKKIENIQSQISTTMAELAEAQSQVAEKTSGAKES